MKIIGIENPNIVTCGKCNVKLEYNAFDLQWTHTEPNYYYVKCPLCGEIIWVESNERTDQMYHEHVNAYEENE